MDVLEAEQRGLRENGAQEVEHGLFEPPLTELLLQRRRIGRVLDGEAERNTDERQPRKEQRRDRLHCVGEAVGGLIVGQTR